MEDKKLLKEFYMIAKELDDNIIKFNELEKQLIIAKENNDILLANDLLKEYQKVSQNIKTLKDRSAKLKEDN